MFNRIETWQLLEKNLAPITWESFNYDKFDKLLSERLLGGNKIYSAAYIMPSAGGAFGEKLKHQNHLRLIELLVSQEYPRRLNECGSMAEAFALLLSAPSIGPFLAYQYATDLNYSDLTNFDEDEFVVAGPGALDGISKCFTGTSDLAASDIIEFMRDNQSKYFSTLGINFRSLWGRPLQLIDCQNIFCEISKYARVAFPGYKGASGRTRIKQKFNFQGPLSEPWYPPKWKINGRIADELAR